MWLACIGAGNFETSLKRNGPMTLANMGVPMIFIQLPMMLIALLPVIVVEAVVHHLQLNIERRRAIWGAVRANLWSTLVGVPVAWAAQTFVQVTLGGGRAWGIETPLDRLAAVTLQSAWLIPYEGELRWMIPAASLVLLVPCLLVSIYVEQRVLRRYLPELAARQVVIATVQANLITYFCLAGYVGLRLFLAW